MSNNTNINKTSKLYVVVDESLRPGLKIAQGGHALCAFEAEHSDIYRDWHTHSNNLVVLQAPDLAGLADSLEEKGLKVSRFHEPDLNDKLTTIAAEPAAQRHLSSLPLAGWTERTRVVEKRVEVPAPSLWQRLWQSLCAA
jgi:hypothetical protein